MFSCWLRHNFSGCVWNFCDQHFRNSCFRFDRVISFDGVISFHVCSRGNAAFSLCTANPLRTFFYTALRMPWWQHCFFTTVWKSHCECYTVHAELYDAILKEEEGEVYYWSRLACHICLCHCCLWYWILVTFFFYSFCRFYITDELLDPLKLCITSKRSKTVSCVLLRMRVCFMFGHNLFWIASRTV